MAAAPANDNAAMHDTCTAAQVCRGASARACARRGADLGCGATAAPPERSPHGVSAYISPRPVDMLRGVRRVERYATTATNWPGIATEMAPPHAHISFESLVSAGSPPTSTQGLPGVQVPAGTGTHGIG